MTFWKTDLGRSDSLTWVFFVCVASTCLAFVFKNTPESAEGARINKCNIHILLYYIIPIYRNSFRVVLVILLKDSYHSLVLFGRIIVESKLGLMSRSINCINHATASCTHFVASYINLLCTTKWRVSAYCACNRYNNILPRARPLRVKYASKY